MDERKVELELLKKCIENLTNFKENAVGCDSVEANDYHEIGMILNQLEDKLIELENDIEGVKYEEI